MSTATASSPFNCIPLLNLIIDFYCQSIKQTVKVAQIDSHSRRAIQHYCDSTWKRLTLSASSSSIKKNNAVKDDDNINQTTSSLAAPTISFENEQKKAQLLFIDACRKGQVWIAKNLLRGGGDLIDINLGIELRNVNYGDNVTPLVAACTASQLEIVKLLLSFPEFLVKDHEGHHHHSEFTSKVMMKEKSNSSMMMMMMSSNSFQVEEDKYSETDPRREEDTFDLHINAGSPISKYTDAFPSATTTMSEIIHHKLMPVDVDKETASGKHALLAICSNNKNTEATGEIVKLLLNKGARRGLKKQVVEEKDENPEEEFMMSSSNQQHYHQEPQQSFPLVMACLLGKVHVVDALRLMMKEYGDDLVDVNAIDPVLHMTAKAAGSSKPKIVEMLTEMGALV